MEISPTLTGPLPTTQPDKGGDDGTISSDFETFLRMLTVQMQNQDPLNPVKSEEFAVQLATFSGVEQQVRTNDLLEALAAEMGVGGIAQAADWVGMEARVPAEGYFDGTPLTLYPKPQATAEQAYLVVTDAAGVEVQRSAVAVSEDPVVWAGTGPAGGPLPVGAYSFTLESYSGGALTATEPVEVYNRVTEARIEDGQVRLILKGGASIGTAEVTALREPGGAA
ncbi:MAG: flagellar hook capping FlgD N-terminal domain-containing protein [Rhodobacter sp.]|nr:flagellar hook capping FlgD N-terminal domain-containing protein [Rhodobacter sp.]